MKMAVLHHCLLLTTFDCPKTVSRCVVGLFSSESSKPVENEDKTNREREREKVSVPTMGEARWGPWNGSHEHASDNDNDDDDVESPTSRLRTRSFSDAEDILNGVGYYESFTLPDNSSSGGPNNNSSNGLHHRVRATTLRNTPSLDSEDTRTQKSSPRSPIRNTTFRRFKHHGSSSSSWRRPSLLKMCLAIGFGSYSIFLIQSSYWLAKSSKEYEVHNNNNNAPMPALSFPSSPHYDPRRRDMRRLSRIDLERRSSERRGRARPVSGNTEEFDISWYRLEKAQSRQPSRKKLTSSTSSIPATLNQLCGFHAQNASLANPDLFAANVAVNSNSRVLITGILNPLGFPLALHLKEQCGVEVIAGIDAMYPNTVLNRLQLQDRIEILTTTIPKLVKPIILPFIGLDPRTTKEGSGETLKSSEFNIMSLNPTHIVHLASFSQDVYSNAMVNPEWTNDHSPYVSNDGDKHNPHLFQLRSSLSSMEQILEGIASVELTEDRPQFIYASTSENSEHHPVHTTTKIIDEIVADTYRATYNIESTAVRLSPDVYGPWGLPGFPIHDLTETIVRKWNETSSSSGNGSKVSIPSTKVKENLDLIYVQDAVDAIIGAMQMRSNEPLAVEVASDIKTPSESLAGAIAPFLPDAKNVKQNKKVDANLGLKKKNNIPTKDGTNTAQLELTPRTSLKEGMLNTIAWHLDREAPFGPSAETGDELRKRFGQDPCSSGDVACHMGRNYLPCSSECNTKDKCLPSALDEARELAYSATEGCQIVLYTQSLGYNVKEMPLHGEYMDDATVGDDEELICNYAFVPRESELVKSVTDKVPNDQLGKFGIKPHPSDTGNAMRERKLNGLNARLLYKGWILIWVKDGKKPLSATDKSLLKLSPGRFFHPDVHHALYVEENFPVSPSIDDVSFLVEQMKRKPLPHRTVKGFKVHEDINGEEVKEKVKYQLPDEPARRATILFSPLRIPNIEDPTVRKYRFSGKKINVYDAIKFMRHEVGDTWGEKETAAIRNQREFYERVPSLINRNSELRSGYEPSYRYSLRHWVRTRWVVHDLTMDESRQLRCDWYQEHVQWGNDLDQLSFAYVMAQREIKRRIAHDEYDDHVKTLLDEHPELKEYTDSHEWHPLETEQNKLYREPINWNPEIPKNAMIPEQSKVDERVEEAVDEAAPLYVRIMSERVMGASRKVWNKAKEKKDKKDNEKK